MIQLENIHLIKRDKKLLSEVNLIINEGDKIALLGESGAGKSTLISILNGTSNPTKGNIKIFNRNLSELNIYVKRKIGTIWQDLRLIEELSSEQNVNCGLLGKENLIFAIKNLLNISSFRKAHKCLELCKLSKTIYSSNIKDISGGQRQRIAIARSIIQEPEILYADEPFNNLDPQTSMHIKNLFLKYQDSKDIKFPKTLLFSIHTLNHLDGFNRVIGLKNGTIKFDLKINQFKEDCLNKIY